jgi:IS605 OrfB family transposase
MGITQLATVATTDGARTDIANPKHLGRKVRKLRRLEREKSRRQKGSINRDKTRRKIAIEHGKVARSRRDYHHKRALALVRENQVIHVEDLNIAGMVVNRRLARAIRDAGWGQFVRIIREKADRYGGPCITSRAGWRQARRARCADIGSTSCPWRSGAGPARHAGWSTTATIPPPRLFSPPGGRRD